MEYEIELSGDAQTESREWSELLCLSIPKGSEGIYEVGVGTLIAQNADLKLSVRRKDGLYDVHIGTDLVDPPEGQIGLQMPVDVEMDLCPEDQLVLEWRLGLEDQCVAWSEVASLYARRIGERSTH